MGRTKAQPKACPICSKHVKSTKDHVIPSWLRKDLVHLGLGAVGPSILLICTSCNGSLGKQFEDQAPDLIKPMLRRQEVDLNPGQQALLAGWLCKTSVLLALVDAQNPADGSASRVDRRNHAIDVIAAIRDTGQPPPNTSVRIGLFDATLGKQDKPALYLPPAPLPIIPFQARAAFGPLLYEVTVTRVASDLLRYEERRALAGNDAWLARIWPIQLAGVWWPPAHAFGWRELLLCDALWRAAHQEARGVMGGVQIPGPGRFI